jgi:hypothetical protein
MRGLPVNGKPALLITAEANLAVAQSSALQQPGTTVGMRSVPVMVIPGFMFSAFRWTSYFMTFGCLGHVGCWLNENAVQTRGLPIMVRQAWQVANIGQYRTLLRRAALP